MDTGDKCLPPPAHLHRQDAVREETKCRCTVTNTALGACFLSINFTAYPRGGVRLDAQRQVSVYRTPLWITLWKTLVKFVSIDNN